MLRISADVPYSYITDSELQTKGSATLKALPTITVTRAFLRAIGPTICQTIAMSVLVSHIITVVNGVRLVRTGSLPIVDTIEEFVCSI